MKERITHELERVRSLLLMAHPKDQTAFFMVQQTLAWALDPNQAASPTALLVGIPVARTDCCQSDRPESCGDTSGAIADAL